MSGENEFTPYRITAEVKRRFKEAFAKNAEERDRERQLEEPHNKLVRELRDGEAAIRKATSAMRTIDYLANKHPELKTANTGIMRPKFDRAISDLMSSVVKGVNESANEKDVSINSKLLMLPDKNSLVLKAYALWQQMDELEKAEFTRLQGL